VITDQYPELGGDLNVADIDVIEGAAGPGRRLAVWLQGCLKRCPGCANGPYLPTRQMARRMTPADIMALIDGVPGCTGLTLSGGEPLLQAAPLIPLLQQVRASDFTVVCYTGYVLEELIDDTTRRFLALVDLLIDGEYRHDLPRGGVYRPSMNQRLHFLSGRIRPCDCGDALETIVRLSSDTAVVTGTLPAAVRRRLAARLRDQGIRLRMC
jgi:anaerobic ribonucleoside-triphosphate reductase activating protein